MNLFALTPSVSPDRLPTRSHVHSRGVAQWLARFVRDPEVYITVSISDLRRGVAQWLARFVRDEEAGGSSPLTPTIFLTIIVTPLAVLPINSSLPRLLPY